MWATPSEERNLTDMVTTLISSKSDDPTSKLTTLAKEAKLLPDQIRRVAEAYNKSALVHIFASSTDKVAAAKPSLLIVPTKVISAVFGGEQEKVASAFRAPTVRVSLHELFGEKVAATIKQRPQTQVTTAQWTVAGVEKESRQLEQSTALMREEYLTEIEEAKIKMMTALDKTAREIRRMNPDHIEKFARFTVNRYQEDAPKILNMIEKTSSVAMPKLQPTANVAILPATEPYLSMTEMCNQAERFLIAQNNSTVFEKFAAGIAETIARAGEGVLPSDPTKNPLVGAFIGEGVSKPIGESLSPDFENKLDALRAKNVFMDIARNDKEIKKHDLNDVMEAYNDSVSSIPEAAFNKAQLRSMLVERLYNGGHVDAAQMANEQGTVAKGMMQAQQAREEIANTRDDRERDIVGGKKYESTSEITSGILSALRERAAKTPTMSENIGKLNDKIWGGKKDDKKDDKKPSKPSKSGTP